MTMITGDITTAPMRDKSCAKQAETFRNPFSWTNRSAHAHTGRSSRDTTAQPLTRSSEDDAGVHETSLLNAILLRANTNESSTKFIIFFYLSII